MKRKSPKEVLTLFKTVLTEAAKFYGRPAHTILFPEWTFISNGRLGEQSFRAFGTYGTLKQYFFPSPDSKVKDEALAVLKRIVANV